MKREVIYLEATCGAVGTSRPQDLAVHRSRPKVNRGNVGRVHFPKHRRTAASSTCAGESETQHQSKPQRESATENMTCARQATAHNRVIIYKK
ncbi:Uncharacterized protein OBRU01_07672 [Operophtera brumata]|uniref:Uncharacterized protein n=1 Tax=Operophtera brumata TaxID=104452 RepID=A0A0L7LIJ3_OPEBR|nr:Uncharacterized protein OBRU01_07672 [Operophtera brumata]